MTVLWALCLFAWFVCLCVCFLYFRVLSCQSITVPEKPFCVFENHFGPLQWPSRLNLSHMPSQRPNHIQLYEPLIWIHLPAYNQLEIIECNKTYHIKTRLFIHTKLNLRAVRNCIENWLTGFHVGITWAVYFIAQWEAFMTAIPMFVCLNNWSLNQRLMCITINIFVAMQYLPPLFVEQ